MIVGCGSLEVKRFPTAQNSALKRTRVTCLRPEDPITPRTRLVALPVVLVPTDDISGQGTVFTNIELQLHTPEDRTAVPHNTSLDEDPGPRPRLDEK